MTENPFDAEVEDLGTDGPGEVEDLDVETLPADEAEDTAEETPAEPKEKAAKAKKAPARPETPTGYIKPVAFAKELTAHLAARGAKNKHGAITVDGNPIPPQQVYSMMKTNGPESKNPFPVHEVDGFDGPLLKLEEALKWWDDKDARVAKGKADKAEKAAKKAAKAEAKEGEAEGTTAETSSEAVEEAE